MDRVIRVHKGFVLKHVGVLSATGIGLYLYNFEDPRRWDSSTKIRCDSSKEFPPSALDAPVVVERAEAHNSKEKSFWNLGNWSSYGADQERKSGDQDPPDQTKNAGDEGKEGVSITCCIIQLYTIIGNAVNACRWTTPKNTRLLYS